MNQLTTINSKIITLDELKFKKAYWNFKELKIVFTNGCFDILHLGHIEYLAKAASLGKIFIIGLNSDNSVKRIKGPSRPIQDERSRALSIAALGFVTNIILFDENTPYELIKAVQPDILVKGSDYKPEDVVGYDIVKAKGGEIKTIDFVDGYSTSKIVEKIKSY